MISSVRWPVSFLSYLLLNLRLPEVSYNKRMLIYFFAGIFYKWMVHNNIICGIRKSRLEKVSGANDGETNTMTERADANLCGNHLQRYQKKK